MAERDDILVAPARPDDTNLPMRAKLAAFVPLTIALVGIGAIILGGVSARAPETALVPAIDTIATGSIGGQ